MSSSYHSNHHDHTLCTSCGKRKKVDPKPVAKPAEEKTIFNNFDFSSLMADPQTMKSLFLFLITLFNKFELEKKEPKAPQHECKCKDHHDKDKDKDKYEWWKHDNKHDESSSKHECKCKNEPKKGHDWWKHDDKHDESSSKHEFKCKNEPKKGHDWWKHDDKHDESSSKHECKCKNKPKKDHDWWKHDDKHDESSSKHECKCKNHPKKNHDWWKHGDKHDESSSKHKCDCKKNEPGKKYRHFELEPDSSKVSKHYEDFLSDFSSSFEYEYNHFKKEMNKHENFKSHERKNFHFELDSSSSEEMQQHYNHKNEPEMPDKIWLADVLSLLYKHNLLNLDNLFDQLNKSKHHPNKPTCNCNRRKHWEESYNHKNDKYEYTKEYYYKGIPLKKIKRKADSYKKFK
ncbi:hypothetical protein [Ureibacillus manganicus]|uniref:Uncharacterized protein n=1 Tax=Ureibacillus manganicus DSM 26584 TaxID=1384049 RepID=A0A0A3IWW4_9BACL|nr:hypothetical protein [Ureibacillus manganicus]KGR79282.1 hypothetical protein CD29_06175 [Ureibacillus manganicus DSM 26584]